MKTRGFVPQQKSSVSDSPSPPPPPPSAPVRTQTEHCVPSSVTEAGTPPCQDHFRDAVEVGSRVELIQNRSPCDSKLVRVCPLGIKSH